MQTAGTKERAAMDNLVIMKAIIENQRAQNLIHTCSLQMLLNVSINYG